MWVRILIVLSCLCYFNIPSARANEPGIEESINFLIRHFELQARATTNGIGGGLYSCATRLDYDKKNHIMTARMDCEETERNKDYSLGGGVWKFNPGLIRNGYCNFVEMDDRDFYELSINSDIERDGNAIQIIRDDSAADSWVGTIKPGDMTWIASVAWFTSGPQCERAVKAFKHLGAQEQDPF